MTGNDTGAVSALPRLYRELAPWWPLLSAPADYAEESAIYQDLFERESATPPVTMLELGCGGGNNASHLKQRFTLTLVDLSAEMLAVSRALNPECEHLQGDMRTVRLARRFDAVFIHDAIVYMTTPEDLGRALTTAFVHCRPGGIALFVPDQIKETFAPSTHHGGHDGAGRALRYLDWIHDPDPADDSYVAEMVYLLQEQGRPVRCVYESHLCGLFTRAEWLELMEAAGFRARAVAVNRAELGTDAGLVFVGHRA